SWMGTVLLTTWATVTGTGPCINPISGAGLDFEQPAPSSAASARTAASAALERAHGRTLLRKVSKANSGPDLAIPTRALAAPRLGAATGRRRWPRRPNLIKDSRSRAPALGGEPALRLARDHRQHQT